MKWILGIHDETQDAYAAYLMANAELHICNGDELIRHMEKQTRYHEFLAEREAHGIHAERQ